MRTVLIAVVMLLLAAASSPVRVSACGDKFLLIGRAVKYQQAYRTSHPAVIVVLDTAPVRDLKLAQLLADAGHRVQVVSDLAALARAVAGAPPDLVIADANAAAEVVGAATGGKFGVLPVLYKQNRDRVAAAERTYGVVLQAPDRSRHPLSVVDEALRLRSKKTSKS